jgi:hypothetical protein
MSLRLVTTIPPTTNTVVSVMGMNFTLITQLIYFYSNAYVLLILNRFQCVASSLKKQVNLSILCVVQGIATDVNIKPSSQYDADVYVDADSHFSVNL